MVEASFEGMSSFTNNTIPPPLAAWSTLEGTPKPSIDFPENPHLVLL